MDFHLTASDLLADLFADVEGDDGELQAMIEAPRVDSRVSEVSSVSSSSVSPPLPRVDFGDTFCQDDSLLAFCKFTRELIRMRFPSDTSGWTYRVDLGGTSQHRWDYAGVLVLVVRHSTCMKAVIPRAMCRNCQMKEIWRRECAQPDDTFFLLTEMSVLDELAIQALRQVQIGETIPIIDSEMQLYDIAQICPLSVSPRKRAVNADEKRKKMEMLRRQVCSLSVVSPRALGLAAELELRSNHEVMSMLSLPESSESASSTALLPLSPVRTVPVAFPSPGQVPASLVSKIPLLHVYEGLVCKIISQSGLQRDIDQADIMDLLDSWCMRMPPVSPRLPRFQAIRSADCSCRSAFLFPQGSFSSRASCLG